MHLLHSVIAHRGHRGICPNDLWQTIESAPKLRLQAVELKGQAPTDGWHLGMVSWIATDRIGLIYLLQRGDKADPVVVLNRQGHVMRSWGKGMYTMPHSIRLDPEQNVWTTDAASSRVYKFTRDGKKLMEIEVGGQPSPCRNILQSPGFCGTTDIAFAPSGHLFITDGYANARVLEYTADGKKVREWGSPGEGRGQFRLPHSIQIDQHGIVYVADRENGRIQRFDLDGKYLGEWSHLGRVFSLKLSKGVLWFATQPLEAPMLSQGWLVKMDRESGKLLGYVEATGAHGMDVLDNGKLMVGPGPNRAAPQWFRPPS